MHRDFFAGPHIHLRVPEPEDIDFLYGLENDPSVWKVSNTLAPFSRFQIEQFVLDAPNDILRHRQLRLMIIYREAEGMESSAGMADLFDYDPIHRRAGIGILVDKKFRGRGIAGEVIRLMVRYAFDRLNLHQLHCSIAANNEASLALFSGHGFQPCGVRRDWLREGDRWVDECMYQLFNRHD